MKHKQYSIHPKEGRERRKREQKIDGTWTPF